MNKLGAAVISSFHMISRISDIRRQLVYAVGLAVLLVTFVSSSMAQGNRVCLYDQPNYMGRSICFNAGEDVSDFQTLAGGWNDRVVSIRIFGNVQATVYQDAAFGGASQIVTSDIPNLTQLRDAALGNWSRQISAIRVERASFGGGGGGQGQNRGNRVCLYDQPNYAGQSVCFNEGEDVSDFFAVPGGWNDRVASIRLFGNVQATIYQDVGFGGASYVVSSDIPNLARLRAAEMRNWGSQVSAMRIERRGFGGGGGGGGSSGPGDANRICFYGQQNYGGRSICVNAGDSITDFRFAPGGWNDRVSSIRVYGNAQATIFENVGFGGASYIVERDIPNLAVLRDRELRNWRREVSSARVERGGSGYPDRPGGGGAAFAGLNASYAGDGQLQLGNRTQRVSDVVIRLRRQGMASFEILGEMNRMTLTGNWTQSYPGQLDVTLSDGGFGTTGISGRGTVYLRNNAFQRLDLRGTSGRQPFSLVFREEDSGWEGSFNPGNVWSASLIYNGAIVNRMSRKVLDVVDQSTVDGASIQQWDNARQPNQTWQVVDLGGGEVAIMASHSNKALTVQGRRTYNGANIVQREWRNMPFQRWRIEDVGQGYYRIVNVGSGKVLDVTGQSRINGASIQQWDYANQRNQQWRFQQ